MPNPTHYDVLEIKETASPEVIKGAFRFLSQKWHPDKNLANSAEAEQIFKQLNEAYSVLSNPTKRRQYDQQLYKARLFEAKPTSTFNASKDFKAAKSSNEFQQKPNASANSSSTADSSTSPDSSTPVDDSAAFDAVAAAIRAKFAKQKAEAAQRAALRATEKKAQQAKRKKKFKRLVALIFLGLLVFI